VTQIPEKGGTGASKDFVTHLSKEEENNCKKEEKEEKIISKSDTTVKDKGGTKPACLLETKR